MGLSGGAGALKVSGGPTTVGDRDRRGLAGGACDRTSGEARFPERATWTPGQSRPPARSAVGGGVGTTTGSRGQGEAQKLEPPRPRSRTSQRPSAISATSQEGTICSWSRAGGHGASPQGRQPPSRAQRPCSLGWGFPLSPQSTVTIHCSENWKQTQEVLPEPSVLFR